MMICSRDDMIAVAVMIHDHCSDANDDLQQSKIAEATTRWKGKGEMMKEAEQ